MSANPYNFSITIVAPAIKAKNVSLFELPSRNLFPDSILAQKFFVSKKQAVTFLMLRSRKYFIGEELSFCLNRIEEHWALTIGDVTGRIFELDKN